MARIKINDLPKDKKISKEEMKKVLGGFVLNEKLIQTDIFTFGHSCASFGDRTGSGI